MNTPKIKCDSVAARVSRLRAELKSYENWKSKQSHFMLRQQMDKLQELRKEFSGSSCISSSCLPESEEGEVSKSIYRCRGAA